MKKLFDKQWIEENKCAIMAEFDEFNIDNPYIKWRRLRRCQAWTAGDGLISYKTLVALRKWVDGYSIVVAKQTYSNTTVKHIYAFAREVDADYIVFLISSKGPYSVQLKN